MNYFIYSAVFILGLIIGSFINCVIYRLHARKSFLSPRSFCPQCKKTIYWYDNIPILSYLLLRGRCRHCRKKISLHYPLIEALTAVVFLVIFIAHTHSINISNFSFLNVLIIVRDWFFAAVLIIIFVYDLKYYLIPDKITLPAIFYALALNIIVSLTSSGLSATLTFGFWLLAAALIAGGFFLLQFVISRGEWIGGGDIRLGLLMGVMLGWPSILVALSLAYIFGSLIGALLIVTKQKTLKSKVPLGTFLAPATLIALLWGAGIVEWYLGITF